MRYQVPLLAAMLAALFLSGCGDGLSSVPGSAASGGPASSGSTAPAQEPAGSDSSSSAPGSSSSASASYQFTLPSHGWVDGSSLPTDPDTLQGAVDQADWSWFDDAVVIGDSVTLKLKNYVVAQRQSDPDFFGKGQFLASGSLGSGNALWEVSDQSVHPTFQGEKLPLEQSVPKTGAKKVYLMLGVNDVAVYGIDGSIENYKTLLDLIQEADPEVEFYIQSATPICQGAEKGALTNATLEEYNQKLEEMCRERDLHFIDVARVLRDGEGFLPREYCSDPDGMGIHLTDPACRMWLGYLLEDAKLLQQPQA